MRVPITRPWFDETDFAAIQAPLATGWVVQGPWVEEFERRFARFVGVETAVACTSATTALHLALAALGIGPGDEVVVPALTWVASANAVVYCGATPVLADIDLATFNLDVDALRDAITPRTRAVMPVHLFGLPADLDAVGDVASAPGLAVVEDAACGLGSRWRGQHVGGVGDFGAFSFHPRKAVTTGEGGMVVGRDAKLVARLRVLRDHGASRPSPGAGDDSDGSDGSAPRDAFLLGAFDDLGYNYRMTDIQGALGCTQMDKAGAVVERRRARAKRYDALLAGFDWLRVPAVPSHAEHSYQSYVCLFAPEVPDLGNVDRLHAQRNAVMRAAEAAGVSTRPGTHAVHALGWYRRRFGYSVVDRPQAWLADRLSITLPLYPQMTDEEQDYVIATLSKAWAAVG